MIHRAHHPHIVRHNLQDFALLKIPWQLSAAASSKRVDATASFPYHSAPVDVEGKRKSIRLLGRPSTDRNYNSGYVPLSYSLLTIDVHSG